MSPKNVLYLQCIRTIYSHTSDNKRSNWEQRAEFQTCRRSVLSDSSVWVYMCRYVYLPARPGRSGWRWGGGRGASWNAGRAFAVAARSVHPEIRNGDGCRDREITTVVTAHFLLNQTLYWVYVNVCAFFRIILYDCLTCGARSWFVSDKGMIPYGIVCDWPRVVTHARRRHRHHLSFEKIFKWFGCSGGIVITEGIR